MRVLAVSPNKRAISPERIVNSAVARHTNRLVRMPAGRRLRSRSMPMIAPSTDATVNRKKISPREHGSGPGTPLCDFIRLQFELRQFCEMACPRVYLALLQVAQPVQAEFL